MSGVPAYSVWSKNGFRLFTFLDNVLMRQYLSGKKLEIETTTEVEGKKLDMYLSKILREMNFNCLVSL